MAEIMTVVDNVDIVSVPESFIFSILESSFNDFEQKNWITSNTLLVGKIHENLTPNSGNHWFNAQFEFTSELILKRRLRVLIISSLTADIIISQDDAFNLMRTGCPSGEVPFIKRVCKLTLSQEHTENPVKATKVKICLLNSLMNIESDIIDVILMNYFQYPRYLYKNDIFSIDVNAYLPELQYTKGYNNKNMIYFKVCYLEGPDCLNHLGDEISTGYIVDDTVFMYQLATQNAFLPPQSYLVCSQNTCEENITIKDFLKPLLPLYLQKHAEKLMNLFHPFMVYKLEELQLRPFFVISGPVGSGKTQLLSGVAKYLGLQYWRVECTGLIAGPSGFNEAKLNAVFTKMKKHLPCLLQLNNIEVLTEDREGNEDVRIVSYFNKLLTETKSDLPFVVVGTTSSVDKLSCELLQNILHSINIDSPSVEERAEALSWISQISHAVAMKVAARTSGLTLSDLAFLVSQTSREKYKMTQDSAIENQSNELKYEDFVVIIDRMNAQTAGAIGAPQVPTVAWTDVGGHNEIKKEIVRSLNTADFGTGLRRSGILLWGPPGTGKTLLAKAVANECKSTFLSVKGPELLNMYVGQSEQNVRQVFERAREAAPCVIFFDELDSLAPNRGKGDSAGVMDRVVSQLLSEMDGLQKNDGVFVLGATNRPDLIDPALLRPGRLDKMLYVGPCEGTEAKLSVLKALTRKFKMSADVDLYRIADCLPPRLTGADLYSVCYNAWQNAARTVIKKMQSSGTESDDIVIVSADDFRAAVAGISSES